MTPQLIVCRVTVVGAVSVTGPALGLCVCGGPGAEQRRAEVPPPPPLPTVYSTVAPRSVLRSAYTIVVRLFLQKLCYLEDNP